MQKRLHENFRLIQIEQLPILRCTSHFKNAALLVPNRVGTRTRGHAHDGFLAAQRGLGHGLRKHINLFMRVDIASFGGNLFGYFLGHWNSIQSASKSVGESSSRLDFLIFALSLAETLPRFVLAFTFAF